MNLLIAFTSTRRDGNARPPAKLRRFLASKSLPQAIAIAEQVHGARLAIVPKLERTQKYPGMDGLLTAAANQPLGIFTADCVSIFLSAPSQGLEGLLHAGWRGVRGGILPKALRLMQKRWHCPSRAVHVWLGPSIGPCCFEVQWDVARFFPATRRRHGDRWKVNLAQEIARQTRRSGARFLSVPAVCTRHTSRFYSYRRDQTDARQISVMMRSQE